MSRLHKRPAEELLRNLEEALAKEDIAVNIAGGARVAFSTMLLHRRKKKHVGVPEISGRLNISSSKYNSLEQGFIKRKDMLLMWKVLALVDEIGAEIAEEMKCKEPTPTTT